MVRDVAGNAKSDKTPAAFFYAKGKSLIFCAYDSDRGAGVKTEKHSSTWVRRGIDWQQALGLGIFYEDNKSKKRWVLECDDFKALGTIDTVFVTAEPILGSHNPSRQQLVLAYLGLAPNHLQRLSPLSFLLPMWPIASIRPNLCDPSYRG